MRSVEPKPKELRKSPIPLDPDFHYVTVHSTPDMENAGIDPCTRLANRGFEVVPESLSPNGRRFLMRKPLEEVEAERARSFDLAKRHERPAIQQSAPGAVTRAESEPEPVKGGQLVAELNG